MALDTFKTRDSLKVGSSTYTFFSLKKLEAAGFNIARLPYSLKILLENLLRHEDGKNVSAEDIETLARWEAKKTYDKEIAFTPARVVLQDFTGVPCVVDLAAMRDAMVGMGGDPKKINPLLPAELVIDHSVQVDSFGQKDSFDINSRLEYERNRERYTFLRWGQKAFQNFKVVPPETGIVHQVNLEYLARVVFDASPLNLRGGGGELPTAYPDTVVGTDSHTTMINGLGVLGWGVGGIEAEAAMLGQPINLLIPQVVGFKLFGKLPEGATATDLVLTVTQMLRKKGVVGKFVEFFGEGISVLSLADRATLANMAPEYGATCGIFPIDAETIDYLRFSGRDKTRVDLVKTYARAQGFFHTAGSNDPEFSDTLELDLSQVVPSLAGPRRPQDRVPLTDARQVFKRELKTLLETSKPKSPTPNGETLSRFADEGGHTAIGVQNQASKTAIKVSCEDGEFHLDHGSVVIAAITSCTNTSNPSVLVAAGLVAKKAVEKGLTVKPWVKTSLAPGSQVVTEYLKKSGLLFYLEKLKFNLVGYGCTTCIGNSGPLPPPISKAIHEGNLVAVSVLSGNRNFEGRINSEVRANYLASPPLVVAYAIAGRMDIDLTKEALGTNAKGEEIYLKDIWPAQKEIREIILLHLKPDMFRKKYADVFKGDDRWRELPAPEDELFAWDSKSSYVRKPTFFDNLSKEPGRLQDIKNARVLAMLGDSVTTDHISPAGSIKKDSPAGIYLQAEGVKPSDFNSYGSRRGNHEVMSRGTFANIRLRNFLAPGTEGGVTRYLPSNEVMSIYDASMKYQKEDTPLIVLAGKEYGSGSSRDWAAKGTSMLGIKAVIAESYERIHRSNLIGMGVLPLQFLEGQNRTSLGLTGEEVFSLEGLEKTLKPFAKIKVKVAGGSGKDFEVLARIDTPVELEYYRHGGILPYVLRQL